MGMDLIVASAWRKPSTPWDFEAAHAAVNALSNETLMDFLEEVPVGLTAEEAREHLHGHVDAIKDSPGRMEVVLTSPDGEWEVYLTGGSSWGDSPGQEFDAMQELGMTDLSVLRALGFHFQANAIYVCHTCGYSGPLEATPPTPHHVTEDGNLGHGPDPADL